MNHPDRVAAWLVDTDNGQLPMEIQEVDNQLGKSIKVILNAQDHTIGNLIRSQLLLNPNVTFAGYRIPHPLDNKVEIRIATDPNPKEHPYVSPRKALLNACLELTLLSKRLRKDFDEQGKAFEIGAGVGLNMGGGGVGGQAGDRLGGMGMGMGVGMGMSQGGTGSYGAGVGVVGMDGDFGYGGMSMGGTQGGASAEDPYQY